jgi:hypothetical protein
MEVFMTHFTYRKVIVTFAACSLFFSHDIFAARQEVKEKIQEAAEAFKTGVDKCGDKFEEISEYLRTYDYKGLIHEHATSGPATITHVVLNDYPLAVVAKPGERIEGKLKYLLDTSQTKDLKYHRLLLGLKGVGPQTAVGIGLGYLADKENEETFTLIAPEKPGVYQIRFRSVENYTESEALKHWHDSKGHGPSSEQTIGVIVVKA